MQTGCIYRIWHADTEKSYIGKTINIEHRIQQHFSGSSKGCRHIHNAIKKYGKNSFNWQVMEWGIPNDELDGREQY